MGCSMLGPGEEGGVVGILDCDGNPLCCFKQINDMIWFTFKIGTCCLKEKDSKAEILEAGIPVDCLINIIKPDKRQCGPWGIF